MVLLTQAIKRTYKFVPLFVRQAEKHLVFDHYYVYTDQDDIYGLDQFRDKCTVVQGADHLFAGNILELMKKVPDEAFFIIMEDFILTNGGNNSRSIKRCCDFVTEHKEVGYLRMNFRKTHLEHPKREISVMPRDYDCYVCLQPAIWRRSYLTDVLNECRTHEDVEVRGPKICSNNKTMRSFGVNRTMIDSVNCLVKGDLTPPFFDLMIGNGDSMKEFIKDYPHVYTGKGRRVPVKKYLEKFMSKDKKRWQKLL